ncbi:MAG TPA: precorrin-3B C(17)-methyltransferase [Desulfobacterales bacterium]
MRSRRDPGLRKGPPDRNQAHESERNPGGGKNRLYVVGIGPGSLEHLSARARQVLTTVDTIVGYHTYIDLIRPLIDRQEIIATGMTGEVKRVAAAIESVSSGRSCAVVSSGDPGIYAMAGLVLEMCRERELEVAPPGAGGETLELEVVPGIPALCAGGALLGAPLMHDFAAVSLSDLLTPWEVIEKRLEAAAAADFVMVLYNPKSRRRRDQLKNALQIIRRHRPEDTPAGVVRNATRPDQQVTVTTLGRLHETAVDMSSIVFIGNQATYRYRDFMVTPRGYARKYQLDGTG